VTRPSRNPFSARLAWRIFLAFFATLFAVVLGAVAITAWHLNAERDTARNDMRIAVQSAAVALAEGGREGLAAWARAQDPSGRGTTSARRGPPRLLIIDDWGLELLGRPIPPDSIGAPTAGRTTALTGFPDVIVRSSQRIPTLTSEDGERFRLLPLPPPQRRLGPLAVPNVRLSMLLMALGLTALASLWLARSITRPVLDLERATLALSAGDLDARTPPRTAQRGDELGRLAGAFDEMAARLAGLMRGREQLLRDVSHEIRSPLARMRLATGLATQGADAATQLARIEVEIGRLDALISDILDVSRLEAGVITRERLDLHAVLEGLAADAGFEAGSQGRAVEWAAPSAPCWINGDPHWVGAAAENVVRNALRHTLLGTTVQMRLEAVQGGYALTVIDHGPGLPDDQLERVFEPFHRHTTTGGTGATDPGGAGLGLAIAARVMRAHGGSITACNRDKREPQGLKVRLWWPAAGPADTPLTPT
jgi:two-component system sensor histidine kinase CpxA